MRFLPDVFISDVVQPGLPFAHLNILISAELSLFSSFFFTAQHSEPYVIAGLMIVLKTLSFNSTGIFLSHITPDTSFHFIHPIRILVLSVRGLMIKTRFRCDLPFFIVPDRNIDPWYLLGAYSSLRRTHAPTCRPPFPLP